MVCVFYFIFCADVCPICHMFCLKGGGIFFKLCNQGKANSHFELVVSRVGMCLGTSVRLSSLFF